MRHLIMKLEFVDNLRLAHPFVKGFDRVVRCASEDEARDVLHGQPPSSPDAEGEEGDPANESAPHKIYLTSFFIGLQVRAKERKPFSFSCCSFTRFIRSINAACYCTLAGDVGPRRLEFSYSIAEFLKMVKGETFDDATMGITLKHIRRCVRLVSMLRVQNNSCIDVMSRLIARRYLTMSSTRASGTRKLRSPVNGPRCAHVF
jgi:poly(A) polymerase